METKSKENEKKSIPKGMLQLIENWANYLGSAGMCHMGASGMSEAVAEEMTELLNGEKTIEELVATSKKRIDDFTP